MRFGPLRAVLSLAAGLGLGVLTIAAWYAVSPQNTMEAMREAAVEGDSDALASYMDMAALRVDLRRRAAKALEDNYSDTRVVLDFRMVTEALVGKTIDRSLSIEGARQLLRKEHRFIRQEGGIDYRVIYTGMNHFVARLDRPHHVDLHFTRHYLQWRLTGIQPRQALPPLKPTV